jgi:hypothetical protein
LTRAETKKTKTKKKASGGVCPAPDCDIHTMSHGKPLDTGLPSPTYERKVALYLAICLEYGRQAPGNVRRNYGKVVHQNKISINFHQNSSDIFTDGVTPKPGIERYASGDKSGLW